MKCEKYEAMLWDYLAEDLTESERKEMEQHLAECEECRKKLAENEEIFYMLRDLPEEELPMGYHEELMGKLRGVNLQKAAPLPMRKKQIRWRQISLVAAAVLLVAAVGGVNGILEMRQNGIETALQTQSTADTENPAEERLSRAEMQEKIAYSAEVAEQPAQEMVDGVQSAPKELISNAGAEEASEGAELDTASMDVQNYLGSEAPDATTLEGTAAPYAAFGAVAISAEEILSLQAEDMQQMREAVLECIAASGGYEEETAEENAIFAMIPVEKADAFRDALEGLGALQQLQYAQSPEGAVYHVFEIALSVQ